MRSSVFTVIIGTAFLFGIDMAQAGVTPQQKCQAAKLKAQGKLQGCLKKNAAGVIAGKTDASADCQTKFTAALQKADAKATAASTSCRYIDNGDGTVSDLDTGLVWEKKSPGGTGDIHDVNNTYTFSDSGTAPNGGAFTVLLGGLNGGTSSDGTDTPTPCFTGHCDWRLPTIQELAAIVDLSAPGCGGLIDPCIDPAFGPTIPFAYRSATTYSSDPSRAWSLYFSTANPSHITKGANHYARAVRGGF